MNRLVLISVSILLAGCTHVDRNAPQSRELEPIESGYTYHSPEYHSNVRIVLFDKAGSVGPGVFELLITPAFTPEVLLAVVKEGRGYKAIVLRPERQIWGYSGDLSKLSVSRSEKALPNKLAERASRLWTRMLLRTKYQERDLRFTDMTSYCFFTWIRGWGTLGGGTVRYNSPRPSLLAALGESLIAFVGATAKDEDQITAEAQVWMDQLESALNKDRSPSQRSEETAAEGAVRKYSEEVEQERLLEEQRWSEHSQGHDDHVKDMRENAVRFGPSGYWNAQGEYRPYPLPPGVPP